MKKTAILITVVIILLCSLCSCSDAVIRSLGKYSYCQAFSAGTFQDFTDYAKYKFVSPDLDTNKYLKQIQASDIENLNEHLDDFEMCIDSLKRSNSAKELVEKYDFDRSIIGTEDYLYIVSEKKTENGLTTFVTYSLYFYDIQSGMLYIFHNNT